MSVTVFVGIKFGQKRLYLLRENGGVEIVTHNTIDADVIAYLEEHLPKLTEASMAQVAVFGIKAI